MTTVLNGLVGGLVVGLVAAVATRLVGGDRAASDTALERAVDAGVGKRTWWCFTVRVSYGGLAGVALVALELFVLRTVAVPPTVGEAYGVALLWSALLLGLLVVVRRVAPSPPLGRWHLRELVVYHLVLGVGLGVWIRLTWLT